MINLEFHKLLKVENLISDINYYLILLQFLNKFKNYLYQLQIILIKFEFNLENSKLIFKDLPEIMI